MYKFMFYELETNYQISKNRMALMSTGGYCISLPTYIAIVPGAEGMKVTVWIWSAC